MPTKKTLRINSKSQLATKYDIDNIQEGEQIRKLHQRWPVLLKAGKVEPLHRIPTRSHHKSKTKVERRIQLDDPKLIEIGQRLLK